MEQFKSLLLARMRPTSVNHYLRHLSSAFSTAVDWGYLRDNPLKKVKRARESRLGPKHYTVDEVDRILGACTDPDLSDLLTIMVYHAMDARLG
jgi:integrase